MNLTLKEIATKFKGSIEGNAEVTINQLGKIETAKSGSITFLGNEKYTKFIYTTKASAVIVRKEFIPETPIECTLIRVEDPYAVFTNLLLDEEKNTEKRGKRPEFLEPQLDFVCTNPIDHKALLFCRAFSSTPFVDTKLPFAHTDLT